jgi:two-component system chemotaxis response regulator CheB
VASRHTRIIVIGGSAGSLGPLRTIVSDLPADLDAAVFVVQHNAGRTRVPEILAASGDLLVRHAVDGERIAPGTVYVASDDSHLCLERGRMRLQVSPKDPWNRPSVNVLFRSAAAAYGKSVAGVLLSGMLRDGVAGLWEVKQSGGVTIVQDPDEASSSSMPEQALQEVDVDHCLPARQIGPLVAQLAGSGAARAWE